MKFIENNVGDLGSGDDFLDTAPKAWSIKEKIDMLDFNKIKSFCSAKDSIKRIHSLKENLCKTFIWWGTTIQNKKELKSQQQENDPVFSLAK